MQRVPQDINVLQAHSGKSPVIVERFVVRVQWHKRVHTVKKQFELTVGIIVWFY